MRFFLSSILVFCAISCQKSQLGETELINGYWQIKEAENPKGAVKQYDFVESVDYYSVKENKGVRKKAKPKIDGSFQVSDDQESFEIERTQDSLFLKFESPYDSRVDVLFELTENEMKIKNKSGLIFTYERFEKINYGEEEK